MQTVCVPQRICSNFFFFGNYIITILIFIINYLQQQPTNDCIYFELISIKKTALFAILCIKPKTNGAHNSVSHNIRVLGVDAAGPCWWRDGFAGFITDHRSMMKPVIPSVRQEGAAGSAARCVSDSPLRARWWWWRT